VVNSMPRPLYPSGNSPWYPLDRRLDRPQSRSGHGGEEKIFQPLPGLEPPIIQPNTLNKYKIQSMAWLDKKRVASVCCSGIRNALQTEQISGKSRALVDLTTLSMSLYLQFSRNRRVHTDSL
jgi:hypothetical protein